ncbi:hypothetical protein D3C71_597370 [compost metagenome]
MAWAKSMQRVIEALGRPPVMAADVALHVVEQQEKERAWLDSLRELDPVPGPNMGPWIESYRHVRPFPGTAPRPEVIFARWCWGTLARSEDRSNVGAWWAEKHRRLSVEHRWLQRQAARAARPPKGHDHPEWV